MVDESAGADGTTGHDGSNGEPGRVAIGGSEVLFGTTSWADKGLVQSGAFYPRKTMTARDRLAFYATRFPMAEIATTYRFPPTPDLARQWVERTPAGFVFDIRAWSLLTGAPTLPDSLWPDLQDQVRDRSRDQRRLYRGHLTPEAVEECWDRFDHALGPLIEAERLGSVILQYPSWFTPRPEAWAELALVAKRLPGVHLAVELRSPKWTEGDACEATLEWLEEHGLAYVCTDGPSAGPRSLPPVAAATSDLAVVRFVGRRLSDTDPWTYPYRYGTDDLSGWLPKLVSLAESAPRVHVIMDNTWGSDAVDNALTLAEMLRRY
ncbi:MAG TPA: DUF72 domain-containing protein [Acidimicrobiales bacterium]|nr:DUF72 domain-containing protein [Acidimicrobiales bacterium]